MKAFYTLLVLLCAMSASAQVNELSVGAVASVYQGGPAYGGEMVVTTAIEKFHFGIGAAPQKFNGLYGAAAPVFVTVGYDLKSWLQVHADPGYNLYNQTNTAAGKSVRTEGGLYLSGGVKYLWKNLYADLRYARYGFNTLGVKTETNAAVVAIGVKFKG